MTKPKTKAVITPVVPDVDIRTKVTQDCIKRLTAAGALFHIMDWEGNLFGAALVVSPIVAPEKPKRVIDKVASVARMKYLLPYLMSLEVGGDPVEIPLGDFSMEALQTSVCSRLLAAFGAGSYTTSRLTEKKKLQVLLMENPHPMGVPEALTNSFGPLSEFSAFLSDALDMHQRAVRELAAEGKVKKA